MVAAGARSTKMKECALQEEEEEEEQQAICEWNARRRSRPGLSPVVIAEQQAMFTGVRR